MNTILRNAVFAVFLVFPSLVLADPQLDREPGVSAPVGRGVQGLTGGVPMPTTPGALPPGAATEAKQDDLNALIVLIDAVLDAIKLDTANLTSDPSTATLQTAGNVILATIDAVLDAIKLDTANLTSDPATATLQTTLNSLITTIDAVLDLILVDTSSIDAKVSTAALQTTGNAILTTIDAVLDLILVDTTAIELNTDSPTGFGGGTVSVTTTATLIDAADPARRSILIRNADSNTVLFLGPTSGVTTANGLPVKTAGASGATGNGGTVIYDHTAAVWGIVSSGTADVRFQTESD